MAELILAFSAMVLLFGFVVLYGAPYLPTMKPQIRQALILLDLKPGQTLLELGSGDGRVLRAAAKEGLYAIGYELNPILVLVSYIVTWKYRKQVRIIWGNYWKKDWPQAQGIFVFLLDKYMGKLDKKITRNYKSQKIKLVSFAFPIPGRKPTRQAAGLFLYAYI